MSAPKLSDGQEHPTSNGTRGVYVDGRVVAALVRRKLALVKPAGRIHGWPIGPSAYITKAGREALRGGS